MATSVKKYHVVQFLELPNQNIDKYVCVPNSWIWDIDDEEVIVAYPIEDPATTRKRVKNEEGVEPCWNSFLAVIKHSSDDYDTAEFWIKNTTPWNDSLDDIPLVICIDDSSNDEDSHVATESNIISKEFPKNLGHVTSADVKSDPDISLQNNSNTHNKMLQKEDTALKNNQILLSPKKEIDEISPKEKKTEPEYNNGDWCYQIRIQGITGASNIENDSETSPSNEKDMTAVPEVQESPERVNTNPIRLVSKAYLFQGEETITESNDNDITRPQSAKNKSAVKTLINFVNKQKLHLQGAPSSMVYETLDQEPHRQTLDGPQVNHIWHRPFSENAVKNTPTALQNASSVNDSCTPKRSQRKQNVPLEDQNSNTNVVDLTASTSKITAENSLDDVIETINADLYERQKPPEYNIRIEKDLYMNKIILTRSDEIECKVKAPRATTKNKTPKKSPIRQVSKRSSKKPLPPAPTDTGRDPRFQNAIVRATTGGKPLHLINNFGSQAKGNQAMENNPNAAQKLSQGPLNGIHFSTNIQNGVQRVPNTRPLARSSTVPVCVDPRTTRCIPSAVSNPQPPNQIHHISELPYANQSGLVFKARILQDPHTGVIYLDPSLKPNIYDPRSCVQNTMQNNIVPVQNIPPLPIPSGYSQEKPSAECRNQTLLTQGANQVAVRGPRDLNDANHRAYFQNIPPAAGRYTNSAAEAGCACASQHHGTQYSPAHSHQEPRTQETILRRSIEANCRQFACSQSTDNRSVIVNSTKANQPTSNENINKEQPLPVHINYSNQREAPIEIDQNVVKESGYQNNTVTGPSAVPSATKPSEPLKEKHSHNTNSFNQEAHKRLLDNRARLEQLVLDEFKHIFAKVNSKFDATYEPKNNIISDHMTKCNEKLKRAVAMATELCEMKKAFLSKPKPLAKNKKKLIRKRHRDDDGIDNDQTKRPKRRNHKRLFVLPPKYHRRSSKWTLKHRTASPGVIEITPNSRVYINEAKLSHIKRTAASGKELARMLLTEIFSRTALSVCSLTGARSRISDPEGTKVKPGLNERGMTVLLNFVEEHRIQKGWDKDDNAITVALRSTLEGYRRRALNLWVVKNGFI